MKKTAAVLPAIGIGDALLMMIASQQLKRAGYRVVTFHGMLPQLAPWFPGHEVLPYNEEALSSFDLIVAENDNSPKIKKLISDHGPRLSIFYPSYSSTKHAPLSSLDRVFDSNLTMADNIALAVAALLDTPLAKDNGITPPATLIKGSRKEQVVLHPTSREITKNWKKSGFLNVARQLKSRGFCPIFSLGPQERNDWLEVEEEGFVLADLPTLSDLAKLIYESRCVIGNDSVAGHLASNLGVPTLTIADNEKRMRLWRPGWHTGRLILPSPYLPNWKIVRKNWQHFITPAKVLSSFDAI